MGRIFVIDIEGRCYSCRCCDDTPLALVDDVLSRDKTDFELSTIPALIPVLSTAAGETLLLLVKHVELIINKVFFIIQFIRHNYIFVLQHIWWKPCMYCCRAGCSKSD
ncbi:uncharacterized protein LOC130015610 [Mercurialis annua]|uniref:uncharacterized protein LOC130015610 n=1 Tax=Mercurialis annua TaxID=3986 RepID=UPI0024AD1264|nr:uncharacterized protein LOC130015610 [Mercurialis annua]